MPRRPRKNSNYAIYHVMMRGNNKQNIFYAEEDYNFYYSLLDKVVQKYGCHIHLFCLMTNHIHLVIETFKVPLSKIMQNLNTQYAKYLNERLERCGHVFQGRFLAKEVMSQTYLIELCYYIHMNPIAANMVKDINNYPWSSHHVYVGAEQLSWVTTKHVNALLNEKIDTENPYQSFISERHKVYVRSLSEVFDKDGFFCLIDPVKPNTNRKAPLRLDHLSIMEISKIVCECMDVSMHILASDSKIEKIVIARSLLTYYAHYDGKHQLKKIAPILHRNADGLSKTMHKTIMRAKENHKIKYWMSKLESQFYSKIQDIKEASKS